MTSASSSSATPGGRPRTGPDNPPPVPERGDGEPFGVAERARDRGGAEERILRARQVASTREGVAQLEIEPTLERAHPTPRSSSKTERASS